MSTDPLLTNASLANCDSLGCCDPLGYCCTPAGFCNTPAPPPPLSLPPPAWDRPPPHARTLSGYALPGHVLPDPAMPGSPVPGRRQSIFPDHSLHPATPPAPSVARLPPAPIPLRRRS